MSTEHVHVCVTGSSRCTVGKKCIGEITIEKKKKSSEKLSEKNITMRYYLTLIRTVIIKKKRN